MEMSHISFRSIRDLAFVLVLFTLSCKENPSSFKVQSHAEVTEKLTLEAIDSLIIPLDSTTSNIITSFKYKKDSLNEYFVNLNTFNNSLYYFNLNTKRYDKIRKFEAEGPNGVGQFTNATDFLFKGDSVIFYDRQTKRLTIVDDNNNVLFRHAFGLKTQQSPYGRFGDWLVHDTNGVYNFSTSAVSYSFKPITTLPDSLELLFDPKSSTERRSYLPLPDVYQNQSWLIEHLIYYRVHDSDRDISAYSFPVDNRIFYKDASGNVRSKYMGSEKVKDIRPLPSIETAGQMPTKMKYYFSQGGYGHLYHDPLRNLYLRYGFSGIGEQYININAPLEDTSRFDKVLIVSDEDFNKVGELQNDLMLSYAVFFRPKGIYILRKTDDEDILLFDIYEIRKLTE